MQAGHDATAATISAQSRLAAQAARAKMPAMNRHDASRDSGSVKKPRGAWRHILVWTAFGLTLVITLVIGIQAMLQTTGFK